MSELRRWSEEGATEEELRLLESSRHERPDPSARARTLLALGVGGPPPAGAPPRPNGATAGQVGLATKLVVLAVVGGAAVAGAAWLRHRHPTPVSVTSAVERAQVVVPVAAPAARAAAAPVPVEEVAAAAAAPVAERERPRHVPARRALRVAPPEPPVEAPVAASTLSAEVAALERAHAALAAQDAEAALLALDRYRTKFPAGRLASEETVLRVQALLARGDAEAATALADGFSAAHPDSPYVDRVRDLLHEAAKRQEKK